MSLKWLSVSHFRNLTDVRIDFTPGLNVIHGQNGSGKTSLLEACCLLASGRSFRESSVEPMIQRGSEEFLLRAAIQTGGQERQLGLARDLQGNRDMRVNGEKVQRATEVARLLPTLVLGPHSVDLLLGAPALRRRFLNWGLFHVEPTFTEVWEEATRCLQQRNLLLRDPAAGDAELMTWSRQLALMAEKVDQQRRDYVSRYQPVFEQVVAQIYGISDVQLEYFRGWKEDRSLFEMLMKDSSDDKKNGYTHKGFHRADVRMKVTGLPAAKVCSRGELKALAWSLVLAQGAVAGTNDRKPAEQERLYLVDDLASEFDEEHRSRVCQFLRDTGQQILLTGVEKQPLLAACKGGVESMFHVKQGKTARVSETGSDK